MADIARILVVKLSAFGDLLHAVPIVHRLAGHYRCPVDWVTQPEYVDLVKLHADVDRVMAFPRKGALRKTPGFIRELRRERYGLAVDLQGLAKSGMVLGLCRADRKLACPVSREGAHRFATERPPSTGAVHALDCLRDTLRYLEVDPDPVVYPLDWPEIPALPGKAPRVGFAPRSRWPGKDWPFAQFAELGRRLVAEVGASIHIVGGPGDREVGAELVAGIGEGAVSHCGEFSLTQLGSALKRLDVLVCNDTGPMHLAAAVGTPVVALFGPTDPAQTGPWGEGHTVLRPPPGPEGYPDHRSYKHVDASFIAQITVEDVVTAVEKRLAQTTKPTVGQMMDKPMKVSEESFLPMADSELKEWGL